jgi:hypothetical protein
MRRRSAFRPVAVATLALALGTPVGGRAKTSTATSTATPTPTTTSTSTLTASTEPGAGERWSGSKLAPGLPPLLLAALPLPSPVPLLFPSAPRLLAAPPPAFPRGGGFRFAAEEDNDGISLARPRTDEAYTQGLRLGARWRTGEDGEGGESQMGVVVGQEIYTPRNLRTTDLSVLRHDRPYAGWLYGALLLRGVEGAPGLRLGADRAGDGEGILEVELAVGVTGPQSEAGALQSWFHGLMARGGFMPRGQEHAGWSVYQITNQLTLDAAVRYRLDALQAAGWLGSFTRGTGSLLAVRVSPRAALRVGTTRDLASLGVEVRAGLLAPRGGPAARLPFELWLFGGADGRYVAHDGLVEGPLRFGATTDVARVPWVGALEAGAGLRVGAFEISYRQGWQSADIRPLPPGEQPVHRVGRVTVAFGAR